MTGHTEQHEAGERAQFSLTEIRDELDLLNRAGGHGARAHHLFREAIKTIDAVLVEHAEDVATIERLQDQLTPTEPAGDGIKALRVDWNKFDLAEAYDLVEGVRREAAQDPESGIDSALRAALNAIEAADCEWDGITAPDRDHEVACANTAAPSGEEESFQREHRYYVFKRKHLSPEQEETVRIFARELSEEAQPTCAVIERDWPEYETAWRMIEARVTGRAVAEERHVP